MVHTLLTRLVQTMVSHVSHSLHFRFRIGARAGEQDDDEEEEGESHPVFSFFFPRLHHRARGLLVLVYMSLTSYHLVSI